MARDYKGSALQEHHRAMREASIARDELNAINRVARNRREASREHQRRQLARLAAIVRFHAAKRRAAKMLRTPAWADPVAIQRFYDEAHRLTVATGKTHHVDHDYPLQGKLVSGLHVENNLQILTGAENSRKRNHFEIEP